MKHPDLETIYTLQNRPHSLYHQGIFLNSASVLNGNFAVGLILFSLPYKL